jgi:hypothetical protein
MYSISPIGGKGGVTEAIFAEGDAPNLVSSIEPTFDFSNFYYFDFHYGGCSGFPA